jgi:hypothetical protein
MTMELGGELRADKVEELKKEIEEIKKIPIDKQKDFMKYFIVDMEIVENEFGVFIDWEDYYQKWYDSDGFVRFIKKYLKPQDIIFTDSGVWGYRIREDETAVRLFSTMTEDEELG